MKADEGNVKGEGVVTAVFVGILHWVQCYRWGMALGLAVGGNEEDKAVQQPDDEHDDDHDDDHVDEDVECFREDHVMDSFPL